MTAVLIIAALIGLAVWYAIDVFADMVMDYISDLDRGL